MSMEIVRATEVNLDDLQRMAKMMVASGYFDASRDGQQAIAQMAIKILAGREMGYGPFASVQGIHVIQGKPSLSANLMAAAVKAHPRYDYRVRKMSNEAVVIEFFENGQSLGTSEFTDGDAQAAGLTGKAIWKQFKRNMLFARALSNGVRWYCPDVFNGNVVYVPEELDADVDGNGDVIEVVQPQHRQIAQAQPEPEEPPAEVDFNQGTQPPANGHQNGNGHTKLPLITDGQKGTLHALGMALYGDKATWDAKRPALVQWASNKKVSSSSELTQSDAAALMAELEKRNRQEYNKLADELSAGPNPVDPSIFVEPGDLGGVELANALKALRKVAEQVEPVAA